MIRRTATTRRKAEDMSWHPLVGAVDRFLSTIPGGQWCGSAQQLLDGLNLLVEDAVRQGTAIWPQASRGLSRRLDTLSPALAKRGITVARWASGGEHNICISRAEKAAA